MLVDSMNQMLKNIILSIVNIAIALYYNVKRVVLWIKGLDSISTMHSANAIQDDFVKRNDNDNDTTEMENEIKRFLHGDKDEDDEDDTYIPYDGPYSETP
jgi:phosphoribosyl-AMP cyclohydrolase